MAHLNRFPLKRAAVAVALALGVATSAHANKVVSPVTAIVQATLGLAKSNPIVLALGGTMAIGTQAVLNGLQSPPGRQQAEPTYQAEMRDRLHVVRSAVETRRVVYGQQAVSGPLVYAEVTGSNNEYLHLVLPLAAHECEEIGAVYFNDELVGTLDGSGNVTSGRFSGWARIKKHLGATDQTADADLIAESASKWTSAHRLRGIAYVYVRLKWSQDIYQSGIPNIKVVVKGKKLVDPRFSPTESAWSDNWALVVRDYLTSSYGLGCTDAEIDDAVITASANICDEDVPLDAASPTTYQTRYTCNGTVNLADRPVDIIRSLCTAAAGAAVFTQGVWKAYAGAYVTPAIDIDESWLRGPVKLNPKPPRRELFNLVRGTFSDAGKFWQPTDFPPVRNATYVTQDGEEEIPRDIQLPFTTNVIRAQRIAKIHLEKSRQAITVELQCNLKAFRVAVWDTVRLTIARLGWDAKVFQVLAWKFNPGGGVDLKLQEEASSVYDWNFGEATELDSAPDTNLPSPFTVTAPTALSFDDQADELSWTASADAFVVRYEPEYKLEISNTWIPVPAVTGTVARFPILETGSYTFRVRAVNIHSARSSYSATLTATKTKLGKFELNLTSILSSVVVNTWTQQAGVSALDRYDIVWGSAEATNTDDGAFVVVGNSGGAGLDKELWRSTDQGTSWVESNHPKNFALRAICEGTNGLGGRQLVAVGAADGSDAYIIKNGGSGIGSASWSEAANPLNIGLRGIAYSESLALYCAVGDPVAGSPSDAYVITSPDGSTWTQRSCAGEHATLYDICWDETLELFVAVGESGSAFSPSDPELYIVTSPDGIVWTKQTDVPALTKPIAYTVATNKKGLLVIGGGYDEYFDGSNWNIPAFPFLLSSTDGITWTGRTVPQGAPSTSWVSKIISNEHIFVAVGRLGNGTSPLLLSSANGINWIARSSPADKSLNGVAWSGRNFVAVGDIDGSAATVIRSLVVT